MPFIQWNVLFVFICRSAREEAELPSAMLSLIHWFSRIFVSILDRNVNTDAIDEQHQIVLNQMAKLLKDILSNPFLCGAICVGKQDDVELNQRLQTQIGAEYTKNPNLNHVDDLELLLKQVAMATDEYSIGILIEESKEKSVESITYCLQPLIAIQLQSNPNCSTEAYVSQLLMIQKLKNFSTTRLYFELVRAALASLCNVNSSSGMNRESMWCAFAFIKVPHILRHLHSLGEYW